MMNTSTATPINLNLRLQEKLDALIQSPAAFAKFAASADVSAQQTPLSSLTTQPQLQPSVIPESGDEASNHDPQNTEGSVAGPHPIDHSDDDEDSVNNNNNAKPPSTYKDYSRVLAPNSINSSLDGSFAAQGAPQPSSSSSAKEPTFPVKLHMILSNPEFEDIIAWLPHGRSWRILQQKAFEERVIPLYFRHGRYSSFARQVNGWGFRRVTHGSDYNSYFHELFLRGMPHLCDRMRRLTSKDTAARKKLEENPAPDFYALSRDNPLPKAAAAAAPEQQLLAAAAAKAAPNSSSMFDMEQALMFNRQSAAGIANLLGPNHTAFNPSSIHQMTAQGGLQGAVGLQNLQQSLMAQQQQSFVPNAAAAMQPGLSNFQGALGNHLQLSGLQNAGSSLYPGTMSSMMPSMAPAAPGSNASMQQQMQQFLNNPTVAPPQDASSSMAQLLAMNGMNPTLMGSSFNF